MGNLRMFLISVVAGGAAATAVWWMANRKLGARFDAGAAQLQAATGTGQAELNRRFTAGRRQLDTQVRRSVEDAVPPLVHTAVTETLNQYGITPDVGRTLAVVVAGARRTGLIS